MSVILTITFENKAYYYYYFPAPGLTVFVVLVYLQGRDESLVKVPRLQFWLVSASILVFCPLVPIGLTIAFLVTGSEKIHHKATMAKLFAGFLDHGPHFVLRLVIVVLIGLAQGGVYNRCVQYSHNKTQYFRLHLSYQVRSERAKRDLSET